MGGLMTFIAVLIGIVWLVRYLRQRELDAFLDADISVIEQMDLPKAAQEHVAKVVASSKPLVLTGDMGAAEVQSPTGPAVTLREAVLDDIHRELLAVLETVIGDRYRIFVQMPLTDFVRIEGAGTQLFGKSISFLVCSRDDFRVVFGIALRGAGQSELSAFRFLEQVFSQIERPLVSFPMIQGISEEEVRETLAPVMVDGVETRQCPKCGHDMVVRKASRGANAGKTFWVCKEFPGCRGIMRIGG